MSPQSKRAKKSDSAGDEAGEAPRAGKAEKGDKAAAAAAPAPKKSAAAPKKAVAAPAKKPAAAPKKPAKAEKAAAKPEKGRKPAGKKKETAAEASAQTELESFAAAPPPSHDAAADQRDSIEDDDEDSVAERVHHTADALDAPADEVVALVLSPEEQELTAIYGDELGTAGTIATTEFRDARTSDEDRPMSPEINAREERHKRWEDRRRRRRDERDQRRNDRDQRGPRPPGATAAPGARPDDRAARPEGGDRRPDVRPERALPAAPVAAAPAVTAATPSNGASNGNGHAEHVVHRVGNTLGDSAWAVFSQLRSSQPLPVKQLAAMMRKRGLIDVDPEQAWPHLKAALIGDERSYRQLGLRPRIVYRGRDLFGPGPVAASPTSTAEASLASALSQLAVATHAALKDRIGRSAPGGFERLVHAYLVSTGYQDIEWVKRSGGISYATALPPDGSSAILVSARSGDAPVDRRGVGELRVGVEAKQLLAGLLLSARELSEDAERELVRPGRSIMVLCGDAFVGALIGAGVGVVTAAAPVRYVDDQLLDELLAG